MRSSIRSLSFWLASLLCGPAAWCGLRPPPIAISELMYNPPGGSAFEFVELANVGPNSVDLSGCSFSGVTYTIPAHTVLAPGAVLVLGSRENAGALRARYAEVNWGGYFDGRLANEGERIAVLDPGGRVIAAVEYNNGGFWPPAAAGGGYSLELQDPQADANDPANWRASSVPYGTPGRWSPATPPPGVRLNELMVWANSGQSWIELYNAGAVAATLTGWSFTDQASQPRKYSFPPGTTIATNAYLTIWCDGQTNRPGLHAAFTLPPANGTLFLYDERQNPVNALAYGQAVIDQSIGRVDGRWSLTASTPGATNRAATLGSPGALRLNEWYAASAGAASDWVELYNANTQLPVALKGLWLATSNGVCPLRSVSFVPPGGFALLYADERPGPGHLAFKLPAAGGFLGLYDQDGTQIDYVEYGPQSEGLSQGRLPDGADNLVFFPALATPGRSNPADSDADGIPDYWELEYGFDPRNPADATADRDGDGLSNLQEYRGGTDPGNPASRLALSASLLPPQTLLLSFAAQAGHSYSLVRRSTLGAAAWTRVLDLPPGTNRTVRHTEPVMPAAGQQFYQLVTPRLVLPSDPVVLSVAPAEDATNVPAWAALELNFREPLHPAAMSSSALQVVDDFNRPVSGRLRFSADFAAATFTPSIPWAQETTYRATLADGVPNQAGTPLASAKSWTFTIAPAPPLIEDRGVYADDHLTVAQVRLQTLPLPGGYTLQDVNDDQSNKDAFEPSVDVWFQEGVFGQGQTNANGTLRQRGQSVRLTLQKSYRVDLFGQSGRWHGQQVVNLNKHPYDLTRVRNRLSFDFFKEIPHLTSLRTGFAQLTMDGEDYGFYSQLENPDRDFLAAHGLDPDGQLYKAQLFEFLRYPTVLRSRSDPDYDEAAFNRILETRGRPRHEKLLAMLDDVNNESIPINRVIEKHFNRDNYLTWFAMNILIGNLDTASQNFFLYSPALGSVWYFLPWDYDGAWDFYGQPNQAAIDFLSRWQEGLPNWWGVALHRRVLKDPNNVAQLVARVNELATQVFTEARIADRLNGYYPAVRNGVSRPPDLWNLPVEGPGDALAQFDAEFGRLARVAHHYHTNFLQTLERPMPVFLGDPELLPSGWLFLWDASYDLQGDALTYDFELSGQPDFSTRVLSRPGLRAPSLILDQNLPSGTYYWRVIIRDGKDPSVNWQLPFDSYWDPDAGRLYHGLKRWTVP